MVLVMLLSGCATVSYDEAQHQVYGGLCEQCERQFTFTTEQWNNFSQITCPFCGRTQDLKMAYNRYVYLQQQQEQENQKQRDLASQRAASNFFQTYQRNLEQSNQNKQQIIRDYQNNIQNQRLSTPTYRYTPFAPNLKTQRKDVYWNPGVDGTHYTSSEGEMCVQLLNGGWKCSK